MVKKILLAIPILSLFLGGCDKAEKERLQAQNDSLKIELETSQKAEAALLEVGALMDSIDVSRQLLKVGVSEGTSYEDYSARMADITGYISETQGKLATLEGELEKSNKDKSKLKGAIASYKKQLEEQKKEIEQLQSTVDNYRVANDSLKADLDLYKTELDHIESDLLAKQQELNYTEARVQELMIQAKVSEGDAYYARAAAVEEAANRTKLAPKKKKETLREALELYKKSLSFGKTEAQAKIDELEKEI